MSYPTSSMYTPITKITRKRKLASTQTTTSLSEGESSETESLSRKSQSPRIEDDRRAHHNELERRRRDHIKDHFVALKEVIPPLKGEKSSRAVILKRAVEYITTMKDKIAKDQKDIEDMKLKTKQLEDQVKLLEQPRVCTSTDSMASLSCLPTVPDYSTNVCIAGPSTIPNLLPPLNAQTLNIPAATLTLPFPLLSTAIGSSQEKLTAFTRVTQRSRPGPVFDYNINNIMMGNTQMTTVSAHQ